ncbi:MAG: CBS domain-containing protein [Candidatus Diapherotrites archaeon]|uniref:CBS domain-containing protein n=1 Tax=Candidatus Iainarchaeum sp. TaxID=3101447 RepID=A0A8T4KSR7_9ARCH|nr:CBS domain-containing protein [Candidatus Diapherotrites archaeon]
MAFNDNITAANLMKNNFINLSEDAPISKLIGKMKESKAEGAVVSDGTYCGIVTKRKLFKTKIDVAKMKIQKVIEKCPALSEADGIERIVQLMLNSETRILPVQRAGKIIGVVHALDVINELRAVNEMANMQAQQIATLNPIVLAEKDTIAKAMHIMRTKDIGRIPITDAKGRLSGILSFRDIVEKYLLKPVSRKGSSVSRGRSASSSFSPEHASMLNLPIADEMSDVVVTAGKKDSLSRIIQLMQQHSLPDIVLVENDRPVGIITIRDLLKQAAAQKQEKRNIQFISMPKIDEIDLGLLQRSVTETYDKLQRLVQNILALNIQFKKYSAQFGRIKYEVHAHFSAPGLTLVATDADWNLLSAVQGAMRKLEKEALGKSKWSYKKKTYRR